MDDDVGGRSIELCYVIRGVFGRNRNDGAVYVYVCWIYRAFLHVFHYFQCFYLPDKYKGEQCSFWCISGYMELVWCGIFVFRRIQEYFYEYIGPRGEMFRGHRIMVILFEIAEMIGITLQLGMMGRKRFGRLMIRHFR